MATPKLTNEIETITEGLKVFPSQYRTHYMATYNGFCYAYQHLVENNHCFKCTEGLKKRCPGNITISEDYKKIESLDEIHQHKLNERKSRHHLETWKTKTQQETTDEIRNKTEGLQVYNSRFGKNSLLTFQGYLYRFLRTTAQGKNVFQCVEIIESCLGRMYLSQDYKRVLNPNVPVPHNHGPNEANKRYDDWLRSKAVYNNINKTRTVKSERREESPLTFEEQGTLHEIKTTQEELRVFPAPCHQKYKVTYKGYIYQYNYLCPGKQIFECDHKGNQGRCTGIIHLSDDYKTVHFATPEKVAGGHSHHPNFDVAENNYSEWVKDTKTISTTSSSHL